MQKSAYEKVGKLRIRKLKHLLEEGTPFSKEYKHLIKLEEKELNKILRQVKIKKKPKKKGFASKKIDEKKLVEGMPE